MSICQAKLIFYFAFHRCATSIAQSHRHNKPERYSSFLPPSSPSLTPITREPRDHQLLALLTHSPRPAQTFHPSLIPLVWVTTSPGSAWHDTLYSESHPCGSYSTFSIVIIHSRCEMADSSY